MQVKVPDLQKDGFTLLVVVPIQNRDVVGPKSWTQYHFAPWSLVENRDVPEMLAIFARLGCACNNDQREVPWFATADQIATGKVVPEWAKSP